MDSITKMRRKKTVLGTTIVVSILIVVGKLLGFGREALIAALFGANAQTDALFLALSMPASLYPAVCNSLSTAFTPLYVEKIENKGVDADRYASRMLLFTVIIGVCLAVLGVFVTPWIVPIFAPGFQGGQLELAITLTRITMAAFVLTMIQYMLTAILNSNQFFIGSQVAALFYNITIIVVTGTFGNNQSMEFLTVTIEIGLLIQIIILALCCRKHFYFQPNIRGAKHDAKELLIFALPILVGNSVVQLNNIVDKALSSTLGEGALSALNYGNTLNTLVISVFVMSLSTVIFPNLTSEYVKGNKKTFANKLLESLNGLTFILMPISIIAIIDANKIVAFVYGRGNFNQDAVYLTSLVLMCYTPRFVFSGIREVLTRAFFAMKDTKTPMIYGSIGVGLNIVFSLTFVRFWGLAGIAIGTSLSVMIIAFLMLIISYKKIQHFNIKKYMTSFLKQMIAAFCSALMLEWSNKMLMIENVLVALIVDTILVFLAYIALSFCFRSEELEYWFEKLKQRKAKK